MKRSISTLLIVLVFAIFFGGCKKEKEEKKTLAKQPIKVKVEQAKRGKFVKKLNYKGTVLPWKKANIGPDVSGRIDKIYKKQGDVVKKGALLAKLDTTTMDLQKKQAAAALEVAKASYKDAKLNFERIETLHQKDAVSRMQYEKAQLAMEAADTQKKSAEANLAVIAHTLENSYMRAPFDGIITSKNHEEGDMINPMMGMTAGVLTLMDLSKAKITLDVPGEDIEKIEVDQECRVRLTSLPDDVFTGKVYSKNLAADPVSKTFKVEVILPNPGTRIKAGVFAEVDIHILIKENTLVLPHAAVIDDKYAVLYNDGTAKIVEVTIGDKNDLYYEIVSGIAENEWVVVRGNYDLKEGALISKSEAE